MIRKWCLSLVVWVVVPERVQRQSLVSPKEDVSESEYQKTLMDMYYGLSNKKEHEVIEEVVVNIPLAEPIDEKAISEDPEKEISKQTFLCRFLKKLGEVVEKIE